MMDLTTVEALQDKWNFIKQSNKLEHKKKESRPGSRTFKKKTCKNL